jgi:IPT/TIG domain
MKRLTIYQMQRITLFLFIAAGLLTIAACHKNTAAGTPSISRIRLISKGDTGNVTLPVRLDSSGQAVDSGYSAISIIGFDSTVASGQLSHQYALVGANLGTLKTITINGVSNPILPGLVTNTSAIFTVAPNIPFGATGANNFTITTTGGTASFNWPIQQPPPIISSISPTTGSAGDTMTITGSLFQGLTRVTFDSVPATIISATTTVIKVVIPAGIVQAFVYAFTPGGSSKSPNPFGFKSIIYVGSLQNGWGNYTGYNSTLNFNNKTNLLPGELSNISVTFSDQYGALQIGYGGATLDPAAKGFTALKFSVYGGAGIPAGGQQAQIVINGAYNSAVEFSFKIMPGVWQTFSVPLSTFGNPSPVTEFVLQAVGAPVPSTIYVTDLGFI